MTAKKRALKRAFSQQPERAKQRRAADRLYKQSEAVRRKYDPGRNGR